MAKTLADTFLYAKSPDYNNRLLQFITKAERINTKSAEFADVLFDIKRRRISDSLSKIATSDSVVIGIYDTPLPKAFRVFVAKDIKDGSKPKVFIDGTDFIKYRNGTYDCLEINWLISYLIAGMTMFIYKMKPQKLLLDSSVISDGCDCFVRLFSYTVDRIYKITSVQTLKKRIDYTIALYYYINILEKDFNTESQFRTIRNNAIKITGIETREASIVDMQIQESDFTDLNAFIMALGRIYSLKDFKIDVFVSMWIKAFGPGTPFALEYFPSFAMMLTNTYIGGYLDNQNTIEKITAPAMVVFVKTLLKIGESVS